MASTSYVVTSGDTLSAIAKKHGLQSWRDIYNHPDNVAFRTRRPNPDKIFPGDVVKIPVAAGSGMPPGKSLVDGDVPDPDADPFAAQRQKIVEYARGQMSYQFDAKKSDGVDPNDRKHRLLRNGRERLLEYFHRASAPWSDDHINYITKPKALDPMPSWCGIFALWATKMAGVASGPWIRDQGIANVSGFKLTEKARRGDVGYVESQQHHFILDIPEGVVIPKRSSEIIKTIEGNSQKNGWETSTIVECSDRRFQPGSIDRVYTCFRRFVPIPISPPRR